MKVDLPTRFTGCDGVIQYHAPIDKSVKLFLHTLIFLSNGQVKKCALTQIRTTEACRISKLLFAFGKRTVIETEFLTVFYCLLSEHSDGVFLLVLFHPSDCLTVWIAAMRQSRGIAAKENRINRQNVITLWVIKVPLICNVVEVWQIFRKSAFLLALLQDILLFKPEPLRVYFTVVFDKQAIFVKSFFSIAKDAQTFAMDPEAGIIFTFALSYCIKDNLGQFLFEIGERKWITFISPELQMVFIDIGIMGVFRVARYDKL